MREPSRLQCRPHHGRFPIPFITHVDELGRPDFRVHDDGRRFDCALHRLCQLCGKPLDLEPFVLVGQHPRRLTFGEPPMHESCFEFAWEVCPWLAGAGWSDRWRAEARDLEILPHPGETGKVIVLWMDDPSMLVCAPDPERPRGWIWKLPVPDEDFPLLGSVVWAECRSRDVGSRP